MIGPPKYASRGLIMAYVVIYAAFSYAMGIMGIASYFDVHGDAFELVFGITFVIVGAAITIGGIYEYRNMWAPPSSRGGG